jgi:hypothetical protein
MRKAADHAGYGHAAFDAAHHRGNHQAKPQVDDRSGGQGLERSCRVGFDLAGLKGQFGDADGQRHGGILEQIERLIGCRRNNQPQGDRQDDETISLRGRQSGGDRGLELSPGNRANARANHLGESRAMVKAQSADAGPELGAVVEQPVA